MIYEHKQVEVIRTQSISPTTFTEAGKSVRLQSDSDQEERKLDYHATFWKDNLTANVLMDLSSCERKPKNLSHMRREKKCKQPGAGGSCR